MIILQLNQTDMFSTGNIMLNTARIARERGHLAYTASKRTRMSENLHRVDEFHYYIGTRVEHTTHRYFSWMTDLQDCGSVLATIQLIHKIKTIKPDIIHLHGIVGWYVNIDLFFSFLRKYDKPVIWTFHDCWAFTGRCIYFDAVNCERWKTGCGNCPQIGYMPRSWWFDLSAWNYRRKKRLFTGIRNLTIVTPSDWLARLTRESFLGERDIRVINNGINLDVFKPTTGTLYDELCTTKKKIVLGVAGTWSLRKGLDTMLRLAEDLPDEYLVVIVGEEGDSTAKLKYIKRTTNQMELAQVYTAADVFVNPTLEDNFPTVNLEALACGTPIVTYETGGSPESVTEQAGCVVAQKDYEALLNSVKLVCENGKKHYQAACLENAKKYDMWARFNDYVDLYEQVVTT